MSKELKTNIGEIEPSGNDSISKELEALEIIKEKRVCITLLNFCFTLSEYNFEVSKYRRLTQEEFDLLKEVLL